MTSQLLHHAKELNIGFWKVQLLVEASSERFHIHTGIGLRVLTIMANPRSLRDAAASVGTIYDSKFVTDRIPIIPGYSYLGIRKKSTPSGPMAPGMHTSMTYCNLVS